MQWLRLVAVVQGVVNMSALLAPDVNTRKPGTFEAAKASSTNVMVAYRQLQLKARDAERARESALRERDEVKRQIYEKNRRDSLMRSRIMSNTSEKLLGIQQDNDRIRRQNDELESDLSTLNMAISSIQRDTVERRQRIIDETEGNGEITTKSLDVYKVVRDLESEIGRVHVRIEDLEQKCQRVRVGAAEAEARAKSEIVNVGIDLERQRATYNHSQARGDPLENYLNILLQINADLIDAVQAKEDAKMQIDKFVVVPRYTWPKGVVKKATRVVTEAAAEQILEEKMKAKHKQSAKAKKVSGPNFGMKKSVMPASESKLASSIRSARPELKLSSDVRRRSRAELKPNKRGASSQKPTHGEADRSVSRTRKPKPKPSPSRRRNANAKGYMRPKSY